MIPAQLRKVPRPLKTSGLMYSSRFSTLLIKSGDDYEQGYSRCNGSGYEIRTEKGIVPHGDRWHEPINVRYDRMNSDHNRHDHQCQPLQNSLCNARSFGVFSYPSDKICRTIAFSATTSEHKAISSLSPRYMYVRLADK